ncbi:hypothetical protein ACFQ0B_78890 [Nonomuraea thailandensis]
MALCPCRAARHLELRQPGRAAPGLRAPVHSGGAAARFTVGPPGTCFATASRLADEHADLLYVEGMVVADGVPFAFDHAWCVSAASDRVIESTLPDGAGLVYLGIALTDGYRREQQALRGVDAVITGGGINLADNVDALRVGLPGHAWRPIGRPLPSTTETPARS